MEALVCGSACVLGENKTKFSINEGKVPIILVNGHLQNAQALAVPNGSITFQLNCDATVVAAPYGFVPASAVISFQLDSSGDILPPTGSAAATLYSNKELNPQNSAGLGTYYLVTFYDQNGAALSQPMWWQFTQAANATVDIGEVIPFATVGGNVIFYPTSFAIPAPTLIALGGVFANAGTAHAWVSAINTDGTVTLTQPNFTDIAGTLSNAQLPSPITFTTITASGLITAQANLQLGVASSQTGIITFEGGTSGAATITGPAVAGTIANPFLFSNSINIPPATVFSINTDTGISRTSAGVIVVGNGTAGNASGTIQAATGTFTSLTNTIPVVNDFNGIHNFLPTPQSQVTVAGTKYYITNSNLNMPAVYKTGIGVGTTMRWRIAATKTNAGTGAADFFIFMGTNGTISDTAEVTQSIGTMTAVADQLVMDVYIVFTSATAFNWTMIPVQSAASTTGWGVTYPAAASQFTGTVTGLTTTTPSLIFGLGFESVTGTPTIVVNYVSAEAFGVS
jgi:hypothetical protein